MPGLAGERADFGKAGSGSVYHDFERASLLVLTEVFELKSNVVRDAPPLCPLRLHPAKRVTEHHRVCECVAVRFAADVLTRVGVVEAEFGPERRHLPILFEALLDSDSNLLRETALQRRLNHRRRGLVRRYSRLPWIPTDEQWRAVLEVAARESLRNRLMLALAYDAALRREELCLLATDDLDPAHRTLRVRAETTKTRRARVVPYSAVGGQLLAGYLRHRRSITRERGALFVSESPRNREQPISAWTWSKVVRSIAVRAEVRRSARTRCGICV